MEAGLQTQLLADITAQYGTLLRKYVRPLHLIKDEETYLSKCSKVRGFTYDLTETLYCVTSVPLDMPHNKRRIYPRTNRNNSIGPVMCPSFTSEEAHNLTPWKEKQGLLQRRGQGRLPRRRAVP